MPNIQSSPRGAIAKQRIYIGAHYLLYNSTAIRVSGSLGIGSYTGAYISANSTGIRLGSRYISTNTTGNTTT
jgi:3-oxoacyl-[acyl-carrier-protein] synthase III